jgi:ATP-dependent Lon protease
MDIEDTTCVAIPSKDRLLWLTEWARQRGATHPAFNFTSDDALCGPFVRVALGIDPDGTPESRSAALLGFTSHLRRHPQEVPLRAQLAADLRRVLPQDLSIDEMHAYVHVFYALHDHQAETASLRHGSHTGFELVFKGKPVAVGVSMGIASTVLDEAYGLLISTSRSSFCAMSRQTRLHAAELLLTYFLHGTGRVRSWTVQDRRHLLMEEGCRIWRLLKPQDFFPLQSGATQAVRSRDAAYLAVLDRLTPENREPPTVVPSSDAGQGDHGRSVPKDKAGSELQFRTHVVIPGDIPPCRDAEDAAKITRYRPLQEPLAVESLPDLATLSAIQNRLENEFPWAHGAIGEILGELRLKRRCGALNCQLTPTLVAGGPGVGKTRFARRLAEELGLGFRVINVGGMNDSNALLGTSRGWSTGQPSPLLDLLLQSQSASALLLLDEVEKAANQAVKSTPITSALLALLEPESNRNWYDTFLQTECDLSMMSFILTTNSLQSLSKPLLSRCRLVYFDQPKREHIQAVVPHALSDLAREWGLPQEVFSGYESMVRSLPVRSMRELKAVLTYQLKSELIAGQSKWSH